MAKPEKWESKEEEYTFNLMNRDVMDRLQREKAIRLPKRKLKIPKDKAWNKRLMQSKFMQGMMNGDSIPKLTKSLMEIIGQDNKVSARRAARTMVTRAENAGRIDSYYELNTNGIALRKVWVATPDDRTRQSHIDLDGEEQEIDEQFSNGCMEPGDENCDDPSEVWNCRCTMRTRIIGFIRADGSISEIDYNRDRTLHDEQMEEEKERRADGKKNSGRTKK